MSLVVKKKSGRKWKEKELENLVNLISKYSTIAVFDLTGVRSAVLHELRSRLKGIAVIKVTKKKLLEKAADVVNIPELKKLANIKPSPIGLIFTNMSSFMLTLLLKKNRIPMFARGGEKADMDVIVPECNTGIPPGPILSEFGKMRIPTRIDGGTIWIAKDTLVAKKGDVISPALASLLMKLEIKSVLKGIDVEAAYEAGRIYTREDLTIDIDAIRKEIESAATQAFNLAVNVGYVTSETIASIIVMAQIKALALAAECSYVSRDTIDYLLRKAYTEAMALQNAIGV